MSPVGAAKGIGVPAGKLTVDGIEIIGRQDRVGIKYYEIVAGGPLGGKVARRAGAGVAFIVIPYVDSGGITLDNVFTLKSRAVFGHDDLYVAHVAILAGKALQKFVHFVRTVVNRNDNRIFHIVAKILTIIITSALLTINNAPACEKRDNFTGAKQV